MHHAKQLTFVEVCYCAPISFLEAFFVGQLVFKVESCLRSSAWIWSNLSSFFVEELHQTEIL